MAGFVLIAIIGYTCIAAIAVFPIYFWVKDRRRRRMASEPAAITAPPKDVP